MTPLELKVFCDQWLENLGNSERTGVLSGAECERWEKRKTDLLGHLAAKLAAADVRDTASMSRLVLAAQVTCRMQPLASAVG